MSSAKVAIIVTSHTKMGGSDMDPTGVWLEDRLKEIGANYTSGPDWAPFAVRDAGLITGQNPASAEAVATLILEALEERTKTA